MKKLILILSVLLFVAQNSNGQLVKSRSRTHVTQTYTQPTQQPRVEQQPIQTYPTKQESNWTGSLGIRLGVFTGVDYLAYYSFSPMLQFGFGASMGTAFEDFVMGPELSLKFNITPNNKLNLYAACNLGTHTYMGYGDMYAVFSPELGLDINGRKIDTFISFCTPIELGGDIVPYIKWGLRF